MKDIKTTSFHRPIKFNHLSVFNSDVCFNKPIICDVYISGNLAVSGTTDISGSARIGSRGPTGGGLIVSGSPGLVPGESQEPIVALSGIELGPGHPVYHTGSVIPSASFFKAAIAVTSSGIWSWGYPSPGVTANNSYGIILNSYIGQIELNDVTLGSAPTTFSIDLENSAIAAGDIVFTTCTESPLGSPVPPQGSINTSVRRIIDDECKIDVTNVGDAFTNQQLIISFLVIGQTPGGPFGPGPH